MISHINGTVLEIADCYLVISVNGVGFKVFTSLSLLGNVKLSQEIEIFTQLIVRENLMDLYGFKSKEELSFFNLLLTISGIGPKGALGVLNQATPKELRRSIAMADYSILTKVSGIGKKTAERIVLELKSKIDKIKDLDSDQDQDLCELDADVEAIEALMALGYTDVQARDALKRVDKRITDVSEKVRIALRELGNAR